MGFIATARTDIAAIINAADTPNSVTVTISAPSGVSVDSIGQIMTVPNLSAVASNVKGIMQPVTGQKDELPEGVRNIVDHKLYLAYNAFTPDATKTYYVTYGSRNYPVEYIKDWSAYLLLYLRIEQHD